MGDTSKLNGPVETCRPKIGTGVPPEQPAEQPPPAAKLGGIMHSIDPAKMIGGSLVRQMARETCLVLIREHARALLKVMGIGYDDMALVLRLLTIEFTELHANTTTPEG